MKTKFALLTVLALVSACACGRKTPDLPPVDADKFIRYASGLSMESKLLDKVVNFDILLPADYLSDPQKRYPVVYMCHGLGDDNTSWNDKWLRIEQKVMELESQGLEPMIYVFPNASRTYYCNKYNGKYPYMDMFATELVPFIDKTYRTIADRQHRATVGYSMGGFGAYILAAKHPELFSISVPLSMSFRTDEQYMSESQDGWNYQWGSIFGGENESGEGRLTEYYKQHCPFYVFDKDNRSGLDSVHWFLHCGDDEEQLLIANDDLHVLMMDNGYRHEYRVADGAHTSGYWRKALEEVLPYIQSVMAGNDEWNYSWASPRPVDIEVDDNGVFCSEKYLENAEETGFAFYVAYKSLDSELVRSLISIMQRTTYKSFAILPCNLDEETLASFVERMEAQYHIGGSSEKRAILAIGDAGVDVFNARELFGRFYLEDISLPDDFDESMLEQGKFYYIGQSDESAHYSEMNKMYKLCKNTGAHYEYRCRNHNADHAVSLQSAVEIMKEYLPL